MSDLFSLTFDALQQNHPLILSPGAALVLAGATPQHPADAARQRIAAGTYPWPRRRLPGMSADCVLLADVAATLAAMSAGAEDVPAPQSLRRLRRPGRPRKNAASQQRVAK